MVDYKKIKVEIIELLSSKEISVAEGKKILQDTIATVDDVLGQLRFDIHDLNRGKK